MLGNSPITQSYSSKVDFLKQKGIIQGFLSLCPKPCETISIVTSPQNGFQTIQDIDQLTKFCSTLIEADLRYFSSMLPKTKLGAIIRLCNTEVTEIAKAERFLALINKNYEEA